MSELEYDHTIFEESQRNLNAGDEQLLVKFYLKTVPDKEASMKAQAAKFKEVEYISITVPGTRDEVARPAGPREKARFPEHYRRFKERMEAPATGTPLKEWSRMARSLAEELSFLNIKTVEQLAEITDSACQNFMGGHNWREEAREFLVAQEKNIKASELSKELEDTKAQLQEMKDQMAELMAAKSDKKAQESGGANIQLQGKDAPEGEKKEGKPAKAANKGRNF